MSEKNNTNPTPTTYGNPYLMGFLLGLVLLASFVIMGRGLGASGAFNSALAYVMNFIAPSHIDGNAYYTGYLNIDEAGVAHPLKSWLFFEVIGVLIGGFISGVLAKRVKFTIEKGPNATNKSRLIFAVIGGALMGIGAKLGLGCTSGQALTGGSVLNAGSWAYMLCVFGGAYAFAWFMRKQWN